MVLAPPLKSVCVDRIKQQQLLQDAVEILTIKSRTSSMASGDTVPKEVVTKFRRGGPKSRTACIVCKKRRVKCDEVKPFCNRCTSTGRKCEGYASPGPPAPAKDKRVLVKLLPVSITPLTPSLSADIQGTYTQRRSFHYFQTRHMADAPGNFEPAFWETLVLRYSHCYPTIKQSLVALSCMYEEHENSHGSKNEDSFRFSDEAVRQYNRAVRELVDYIASNQQDSTVALVSCLIFVWIELLQGNIHSAIRHLNGGLKIINDFKWGNSWSATRRMETLHNVNEIHGSLTRSFSRLRIQAVVCGQKLPTFAPACSADLQAFATIPSSFGNIFESRNYLDNEFNDIFDFFGGLRDIDHGNESDMDAMRDTKAFHLKRLEEWKAATTQMTVESVPAQGHPYSSGVLYLDLYYTVISVILKTMCAPSEMVFDEYLAEFQHIYSVSETLIQNTIAGSPILSLDMCVIPPLGMLLCKCRYLPLRRQALKLLQSTPDQEGIWDRVKMLKKTKEKIDIEEAGRGDLSDTDPLPEEARIYKKRIQYRNQGEVDETVVRYFYLGRGPVEAEYFQQADLAERKVDIMIREGVEGKE